MLTYTHGIVVIIQSFRYCVDMFEQVNVKLRRSLFRRSQTHIRLPNLGAFRNVHFSSVSNLALTQIVLHRNWKGRAGQVRVRE